MARIIKSKIEFEFDADLANEGLDTPMTDDELIDRIRTLEGAVNAALGRTGETTDGAKAPDRHAEAGEVSALH